MDRVIGEIKGEQDGPLLIFVGGIHGNEGQGVDALINVFNSFSRSLSTICGKAIALRGNLKALEKNQRFIDHDLNRVWKKEGSAGQTGSAELDEVDELKKIIEGEASKSRSRVFLFDLHTTSAPTIPFIVTKNDKDNQSFIEDLSIPYITGLDGFLDGTMLSWMCGQGHCGLAFEAGQHYSKTSLIKHEAFVKYVMIKTGFDAEASPSELKEIEQLLDDELKPKSNHFKLTERYQIDANEKFTMEEGFSNFQRIFKGQVLAQNQYGDICSAVNGNIFMPLYQEQGDDGFFIIEPYK